MKFVNNENIFNSLSDQTDYLVIGVIGEQGVGKSTILSKFLEKDSAKFQSQTDETLMRSSHQTQGIQLAFSSDHVILLDTQVILFPLLLSFLLFLLLHFIIIIIIINNLFKFSFFFVIFFLFIIYFK